MNFFFITSGPVLFQIYQIYFTFLKTLHDDEESFVFCFFSSKTDVELPSKLSFNAMISHYHYVFRIILDLTC